MGLRLPDVAAPVAVLLFAGAVGALAQEEPAARLPPGVVAVVNGIPISEARVSDRLWRESGSVILDYTIKAEIVREEARRRGIAVSPEEIRSRMSDYKTAFITAPGHTPRDWELFTRRFGLSNIEAQQTNDLLVRKIGEDEAKRCVLSEADKTRVLDDLQRAAHSVHARILLVGTGPEFGGRTEADAKARAQEAMAKIAGGTSWQDACIAYSDDVSTRTHGGDLGFVTRDQVDKPLEDELFRATPGPDSRFLVRVPSGYVVAAALERKDNPPPQADIDKAMDEALKRKKQLATEITTWYPEVEKSYAIERLLPYRRAMPARQN